LKGKIVVAEKKKNIKYYLTDLRKPKTPSERDTEKMVQMDNSKNLIK